MLRLRHYATRRYLMPFHAAFDVLLSCLFRRHFRPRLMPSFHALMLMIFIRRYIA